MSVCRFTGFFGLLRNHCYSFHRTKWRLVTSICRGPGPDATRMPFSSPKFKSTANFSAPAQEGNLFFLSGRSARKKIHNFPIKSSHLCRTSTHVWLSSSACDHCCAYQLICIMTISTYTTGASTTFSQCKSLVDVSFPTWHRFWNNPWGRLLKFDIGIYRQNHFNFTLKYRQTMIKG